MKKTLLIILFSTIIILSGCSNSNNQPTKIDSEKWYLDNGISIEDSFSNQINECSYIKDLENFLSYNIISITEDKPFKTNISFSAKFDEESSTKGGIDFIQEKDSITKDLEYSDFEFSINTESRENNLEPLILSGDFSVLYKDDELYAKLHRFGIFMGEGNIVAKMYTLLGDSIINNRVNLEIHSGGIVSIDEKESTKIPHITGTLKSILKSEGVGKDSPNFINNVTELIDTINSYINLGISTKKLQLTNHEISYFKLGDNLIQKLFTGEFLGEDSSFHLSLLASKNGLECHLYNIKEYNNDIEEFEYIDKDFLFLIQENKKSEYIIEFKSTASKQIVAYIKGKLKYDNILNISADFKLEPLELIDGQKISGKFDGSIEKKPREYDKNNYPELTGNILSISELLSSL